MSIMDYLWSSKLVIEMRGGKRDREIKLDNSH